MSVAAALIQGSKRNPSFVGLKSGRVASGPTKPFQGPYSAMSPCLFLLCWLSKRRRWKRSISLGSYGVQLMRRLPSPWRDAGTLAPQAAFQGTVMPPPGPRVNEWTLGAKTCLRASPSSAPIADGTKKTHARAVTCSGSHSELVSDQRSWLTHFLFLKKTNKKKLLTQDIVTLHRGPFLVEEVLLYGP